MSHAQVMAIPQWIAIAWNFELWIGVHPAVWFCFVFAFLSCCVHQYEYETKPSSLPEALNFQVQRSILWYYSDEKKSQTKLDEVSEFFISPPFLKQQISSISGSAKKKPMWAILFSHKRITELQKPLEFVTHLMQLCKEGAWRIFLNKEGST
jgi:hypothetical protein